MKSFNLLTIGILALSKTAIASSDSQEDSDKCQPSQDCWPSLEEWNDLRDDLGGNLLNVRPFLAPCFDDPESSECQDAFNNYENARYRVDQPGSMMMP